MNTIGVSRDDYSSPQFSIQYTDDRLIQPPRGDFFHYTSFEAGFSMLSAYTDIIEIWPSHLLYSNDSQEYEEGKTLIRSIFDTYKDSFSPKLKEDFFTLLDSKGAIEKEVYIMCFSSEKDSLTQWKHYGKGCGLAIQFNLDPKEVRFSGLSTDKEENSDEDQSYPVGPFEVIYDHDIKVENITKIIEETIANCDPKLNQDEKDRQMLNGLKELVGYCPLFKHEQFSAENESRLIFRPFYIKNEFTEIPQLINYRQSNGRETLYIKVQLHPRNKDKTIKLIKSIIVGPGYNQDLICNAVKHLAARRPNLIAANSITPSKIPFRG